MTQILNQAADPMHIAESEYAIAAQIGFTKFTSCIGVIGMTSNRSQIGGVHLVLVGRDQNIFSAQDVGTVVRRVETMGLDRTTLQVRGCDDVWRSSNRFAYLALLTALGSPATFDDDECQIQVSVVASALSITKVP